MIKVEEWRSIKDHPNYMVSNLGRVKSIERYINCFKSKRRFEEKVLKPSVWKDGYLVVTLNRKHKQIHRLVMEAFEPNKSNFKSMPYEDRDSLDYSKLQINHKDENIKNNNLDNLEWCTCTYNNCYGSRLNNISKRVLQYDLNRNIIKEYPSTREAGRQNNFDARRISECCLGQKQNYKGYCWEYIN